MGGCRCHNSARSPKGWWAACRSTRRSGWGLGAERRKANQWLPRSTSHGHIPRLSPPQELCQQAVSLKMPSCRLLEFHRIAWQSGLQPVLPLTTARVNIAPKYCYLARWWMLFIKLIRFLSTCILDLCWHLQRSYNSMRTSMKTHPLSCKSNLFANQVTTTSCISSMWEEFSRKSAPETLGAFHGWTHGIKDSLKREISNDLRLKWSEVSVNTKPHPEN